MPDTLRDDISLVIERHVLHLTDAAAKQLDIRDGLRPAVDRIIILIEAREAKLVEALEKIEHNGCTEDAHVARAALATVKEGK